MMVVDEEGRIGLGLDEAQAGDMGDEPVVPCPGSLMKTIE
jgi:hypothetical protein